MAGHTGATDLQSLERWHGVLKSTLPTSYHKLPLKDITVKVECGVRSIMKEHFANAREEIDEGLTFGQLRAQNVCKRMLSGDWLWTERSELEDGNKRAEIARGQTCFNPH